MIQPLAIVSNTAGEQAGQEAVNLINQSGLAPGYVSGVTDFDTYAATTPHALGTLGRWNSAVFVGGGVMVFDLGQTYSLDGMALWQDSPRFGQDINNFQLRADLDGDFSSGAVLIGSFPGGPNQEPNGGKANVYSFAGVSARYVEWTFGNNGNGFGTTAKEIAFRGSGDAQAVPEPSSLALLAVGGGCLAGCARRGRKGKAA